jgi:hypothetical protein
VDPNNFEHRTAPITPQRAIELVNLGIPVFKVWTSDPRKNPATFTYRAEVGEPLNREIMIMARRDPRVTIIRSPHAFVVGDRRDALQLR